MTTTLTAGSESTPRPEPRPAGRIEVRGDMHDRFDEILSPAALDFIAELHDRFMNRREEQLVANAERFRAIDAGADPAFPRETASIRRDPTWRVAGAGPGLEDRRIEITGPTDRRSTVEALNSGAKVWLADHEDALSPTWSNVIDGQLNLADAIRRRIDFVSEDGTAHTLGEHTPTIVFRPRGWHLDERHLRYVDAAGRPRPASASLVDYGLYLFHNAHELVSRGAGPYFYLPKLESRHGARLWDDVFSFSERAIGLPHGTIRATVLIETITAAFEMDEILYELRDHCAGLNAGRWDYLFSIIKNYRNRGRSFLLPDRGQMNMTVPFMRAYTELLVATCHKRGAHAIGGMSAFIPNPDDEARTTAALEQVAIDKRREASDGFDGSWVAHPGLIETACAEFDAVLGERPNQLDRLRDDVSVTGSQLIDFRIPDGTVTVAGIRENVSASLRYLDSWLRGTGAVPIDDLLEDVSTAEISRCQLWQWIQQGALTDDGLPVVRERVEWIIDRTLGELPRTGTDRLDDAAELLREMVLGDSFPRFLTLGAYERHLDESRRGVATRAA
ncbi:malate synthase A [Pseudoclavibacter chungangensis]|uniref:Malate synthase n=1 Tax=Pseudoclavibacter chungangensis TaxID=587635 RepID=A0A7J5BQU6_9MICO|nr:malate synthase A [Pseudoclavibacter chungangensis]KAB1656346.1 malate synthase A [Pseudoclavibacter chungangensis]NYJ67116.1 malate synthase [Pseudoclavibacter chungangensis]